MMQSRIQSNLYHTPSKASKRSDRHPNCGPVETAACLCYSDTTGSVRLALRGAIDLSTVQTEIDALERQWQEQRQKMAQYLQELGL